MINNNGNILIIEDDKDIRDTVCLLLEGEGFTMSQAANGEEGIALLSDETNLVILDVMMPGKSGYEICKEIRTVSFVPILFLTAKSKENDKILGFTSGGDDYLTKPFSYAELSARVKALIRRRHEYDKENNPLFNTDNWIELQGLRINSSQNEVYVNQQEQTLTETEYEILLLLMRYPSKVFSVKNIYESVWQEDFSPSYSNTVMVHIRNLRTKVEENPQSPQYILTVWGKGYKFGLKK